MNKEHKLFQEPKKWVLDKSGLSESDLALLKKVCFPESLGYRDAVQRRVAKPKGGKEFFVSKVVSIDSIKYVQTAKKVAVNMALREQINPNLSSKEKAFAKQLLANEEANNAFTVTYFDGHSIEEELNWLLSSYGDPKPTPSVKKEKPKKEKKEDKPKGLAPAHKSKIKKLYLEESKSLDEIIEVTGYEKELVKEYLIKLSNG